MRKSPSAEPTFGSSGVFARLTLSPWRAARVFTVPKYSARGFLFVVTKRRERFAARTLPIAHIDRVSATTGVTPLLSAADGRAEIRGFREAIGFDEEAPILVVSCLFEGDRRAVDGMQSRAICLVHLNETG